MAEHCRQNSRSKNMTRHQHTSPLHLLAAGVLGFSIVVALKPFGGSLSHALLILWNSVKRDLGNVLAALVAVCGYMFEHWNTRKTQRRDAQIERVNGQSHKFLVPVTLQFHSIVLGSILHFVDNHLDEYDDKGRDDDPSKPDEEFLESGFFVRPTNLKHSRSHRVLITETILTEPPNNEKTDKRFTKSLVPSISLPRELPPAMYDAVLKAMPSTQDNEISPLWHDYEQFVRFELVPGVQQIADMIEKYGDLMEPVPPERLNEIFGRPDNGHGQLWHTVPRTWFYSQWLAYARGWKGVIDAWDHGRYTHTRPRVDFPCGMFFFNIEGQTIVSQVEKELVGMSQMHGHTSDPNKNTTVVAHES